jgi:tetratricopeptide (TPR) repeat protein
MSEAQGTGSLEQALLNGARLLAADPQAAAEQAREILRINPESPGAHRLLGAALRKTGRHEEAGKAELDAIGTASRDPVLIEAAAALAQTRLGAAERLLRPYLGRHPDDALANRMLAEIAARTGYHAEAERLLRRVLDLAPGYQAARSNLAALLHQQSRSEEAAAILRREAKDESDGAVPADIGDDDEGLAVYEELLRQSPDQADLWVNYGHSLKMMGRPQDAVVAYRRAVELAPHLGQAWWSLADFKTVRLNGEDIAAMSETLEIATDEDDRLHLHFALGKALEDEGRFEQSFHHYEEGNRIKRAMLPYDPAVIGAHVRKSELLFTLAFFARGRSGCPAPDPIFILGMPRAGSTLLEQILASHPSIEGTRELTYIPALTQAVGGAGGDAGRFAYLDRLDNMSGAELAALGDSYLWSSRAQRRTGRPFFIDKMPANWQHIGFIHLILPNARIIDMRRHPLGCGFSNFKQLFARQAFSYGLRDIGLYYADYVRMLGYMDRVLPGRIHRVFYEELIENPELEIRRLLDHLCLPFDEACLNFHQNDRAVRTISAEQVRQPISREGAEQWKAFEPWLGPMK